MASTRNAKKLVGSAIILTASAFMLAAYGTLYRMPLAFLVVYLVALATGGTLAFLGHREEIESESDRSKFTVNT